MVLAALLATGALALVTVRSAASSNFLPHGFCYLWNPRLLALHIVSDAVIFLSYMAISWTLLLLYRRLKKHFPFSWIVVAFGLFIVACGLTHLLEIIVLWLPVYWLAGEVKAITAVASAATAIVLPFLVPKIQKLFLESENSRRNERRFLAASNSSKESFFILESVRDGAGEITDFRFAVVNENGARLLSETPESLPGKLLCGAFPINRTGGFFDKYKKVVETGRMLIEEFPIDSPEVDASWLRIQVVKLDDGVAIWTSNLSEQLLATQSLTFTRSLVNNSPFAVIAMSLDGLISEFNPAAERMLWYTREEMVGKHSPLILHDPDEIVKRAEELTHELGHPVKADISVFLAKPFHGVTDESEWTYIRKDGSRLMVQVAVTALTDDERNITGWVGIAYDITERKRLQDYISHLAHHDVLTGLPTRTLFQDRLHMALQRALRDGRKAAILVVDLDNFKQVNDTMGHAVGDDLLKVVAGRLQESVRMSDTVARMGGDEFVVLLNDLKSGEEAAVVADKLVNALRQPMRLNGDQQVVSASVGLCIYPDDGVDAESLLRNADAAMYVAKSDGRDNYQVFSPEIASTTARRRQLEQELHNALARGEFHLVYQPQISFDTNSVTGVEALLRWESKALGTVMPSDFIAIAEDNGLILPIGEWVLRTACRDVEWLTTKTGKQLNLAVNLSPRQFQQDRLPSIVGEALRDSGITPHLLELEITETLLIRDSEKAMRILDEVRSLGVKIAIDDFGTGLSSMSYILRSHVDRLKIDQSFIHDVATEPNGSITRAIITLAHGLKINVMAEGVEDVKTRDLLRDQGCDHAQGYFYSRAVPVADLPEVIDRIDAVMSAAVV
jgi:diguanylate cyclase (GGDEF)-like protein/PAS domain S-box-containing protein